MKKSLSKCGDKTKEIISKNRKWLISKKSLRKSWTKDMLISIISCS